MSLFKSITPYLSEIAIGFIVIGTIIGAYVTNSFRKKNIEGQKELKELGLEINDLIGKVRTLNENTNTSTQNIEQIQSSLMKTVKKLESATDENLGLTGNVVMMTEEIKVLQTNLSSVIKELNDFATGGDSFIEFYGGYKDMFKGYEISFRIHGQYKMRNVKVKIIDNYYALHKRDSFDIHKSSNSFVKKNDTGQSLELFLGDVAPYENYTIGFQDPKFFDAAIDFRIEVEAENFNTYQRMIEYDKIKNQSERKYFSQVTISYGKERGKVLLKQNYQFPVDKNDNPITRPKKRTN